MRKKRRESRHTQVGSYPDTEAAHRQHPENGAQRLGHAQLDRRGRLAQVEREHNRHGHDGHGDGEAEVREEGFWEPPQRLLVAVTRIGARKGYYFARWRSGRGIVHH